MKWYAVHAKPAMEQWAETNLRERGFVTYLPRYRKRRSHARKVDYRPAPLFPGYLFVQADFDRQSFRAANSAQGVLRIVSFGLRPAPLADDVLSEIRSREGDDGYIQMQHVHRLCPGQAVQITQGAFSDHAGMFQCETDGQRVMVLLNLLGREVRTSVARTAITPIT